MSVCVFVCLVPQLCSTLYDIIDCSPPGSSVHGLLQARILEWVAIPFSRGSSWPKDQTQVSCIAGGFFTVWATLTFYRMVNSEQLYANEKNNGKKKVSFIFKKRTVNSNKACSIRGLFKSRVLNSLLISNFKKKFNNLQKCVLIIDFQS